MYTPPSHALSERLGIDLEGLESGGAVTIPAPLLRHLLQIAVAASDFDERSYLEANPDVAAAVSTGLVRSARVHFVTQGYFERRTGGHPRVDEAWYCETFPDVAEAVQQGVVASATEHYVAAGAAEMRPPSKKHQKDAQRWSAMLGLG